MFRFNKNNNGNGLGTVAAALCAFTFIFPSYALGEVLDDYDYPYVADFESITSVHDDALDTDPVNDVNGQADWTVQGDWGMAGDHGAWINHGGSYHLDNNPSEIDQFNHQTDQNVTMNGWVDIPTTSVHPELSFYYKLNLLHIYDDVFVEVQTQGTTTWTELKKYEIENNQANYAQSNISLADYKGQSIRIRFRQHFSSATGPRLFVIDDLRFGEEVVDDYDYPYANNFDVVNSLHDDAVDSDPSNDINGQDDWNLQSNWGMSGTHNGWNSYSGTTHLDSNPTEQDQRGHRDDQLATLKGWVEIPVASINPVVSFQYKLNLIHIYDDMVVEIQQEGTPGWIELKRFEIENNQPEYAQANLSLAAYKGQSIRVRFRQFYSDAPGARQFVVDDFYIGEEVVDDYDYPYENDFEATTSVHDASTDSDPTNDVNGQADWNLQGDWGMSGTHGDWSSYSGSVHLDNTPSEEDQRAHNVDQFATMKGWVDIPTTGTPTLNYRYKLNLLHTYDRVSVYVQTAGSDLWEVLAYYTEEQNNTTYAQETISLDAYKGQAIRIRLQQINYDIIGARLFVLDDFRIGEQQVEDYDYPYENDFESVTSVHDDASDNNAANDINGQPDWNVQGDWGVSGTHGAWTNHSGNTHLDNNPQEESQRAHDVGHITTMNGMVDIPATGHLPQLSFYYKLDLLHIYDYQSVEIQVAGTDTWAQLKEYRIENNHAEYTQEVISLAGYKGQSVRVRFRQKNYGIEGARLFVVDDFRIGDRLLEDYDYPYENDFESATSIHDAVTDSDPSNDVNGQADWNLQGTWGMSGSHGAWSSYSATRHLDNNPAEIDQAHYNMDQLATLKGLVEIPADSISPVLNYRYKLNLIDIYDRLNVYIQSEGSETWDVLSYYSDEQNNTTYAQETIALDAYKGQSIRIRFQQVSTNVNGARLFVLDDFRIGELQVEDYDYPYENDFESATSVHDNATDTDPSNDINGRADWNTQGDWGITGAHNTWTNHSGAFHLDGNVTEEDQRVHDQGHIATLNGVVEIPADSVTPELSYYYKLNLHDTYDDIFVEIQAAGTNSWTVLTTYEPSNNHGDYTRESLSLVAYKGQSIRIRFRQSLKYAVGSRMFIVDDLRIGEQQLDDYDYPYVNDFESITSVHDDATDNSAGNDINGQADWNLQGDWGINGTHNDWTSYSGIAHLDNNPSEKDQRLSNKRQYATMNGLVDIPTTTIDPVLSYFYKLNLINLYEYQYVEIQVAGTQVWTPLKTYSSADNQTVYTPEVIDLNAYKGQSIRIRFRQDNRHASGPRLFVIDDLRIAERNADTDSDGIADTHDACPATPVGESIDANGCSATQRDTDNDTVNDAIDICPDTPAGETADLEGCSNSQKDEDSDGVINVNDQCPSTPNGETVDINGCSLTQLDTDNDTVNDATDICPNTPTGETADAQGCSNSQKDSDNDTINDALDICPNTPTGETVDVNGCSATQRDTDNDTINDAIDICPNTPAGETADAQGCSNSQKDSDNDTINDAADICPNTPSGETADVNGCSATQRDTDNDTINDATDACPNTPTGEAVDAIGCSATQRDSDNDGTNDANDICPNTPSGETADGQGCSTSQKDSDSDGVNDAYDICPNTPTGELIDTQGCSDSQKDTDNDGHNDAVDLFPSDPTEWADLDSDGIGDNADTDRDGDNVANTQDAFPNDPTEWADMDNDGIGDNTDTDRDGDGVANVDDYFPDDPNASTIPGVTITEPATLSTVGVSPIEVSGTLDDPNAILTINGVSVSHSGGAYQANVALEEGHNAIIVRAIDQQGKEGTATISVSLDKTPPQVTIESPTDGQVFHTNSIIVTGLVNDVVRGTITHNQAGIIVNGVQGTVANRSYMAENVTLTEGENTITVAGSDSLGNTAIKEITVTYQPTTDATLDLHSGQTQTGTIKTTLAQPLEVKATDSLGNPIANKAVVFRVIQGSGQVAADTIDESQGAIVNTDAQGIARTNFKLGARAGDGIHRVRAKAVGLTGEVLFFANANANPGDKINVIAGNNQRGIVRQPLPQPFTVAVVDDGANLIQNAQVEFTITQGTGTFQNQLQTYTTTTDTDGRASAVLTLGPEEGLDIQRVTATLIGTEAKAGFTASAFMPGDSGDTKISGVVLDNQDKPIPGVTVRVDGHNRQAITNNEGQFTITNVPVGPVHLLADGSTATVEGEWPTLSYNIVTVAGVDNPLNAPIYMVKLDTENAMTVGAQDIDYTLPEVPGFKLTVKAGSVTFPDGSKEGDISVTVVNANKVPMPPPNGMQPQFIVTIQPAGAKFDPPAPLTLPNTDGHAPGAQVEMYSYDHDLEEFVTIGLGTVSKDGTIIESNPGVGVIKAGWHCGSQPDGSGCGDGCTDPCYDCGEGCSCDVFVPKGEIKNQDPHDCKTLLCDGSSVAADETSDLEDIPYDCKKPSCIGKEELQSPDAVGASSDHRDCQKCEEGNSIADLDVNGAVCEDDCGVCEDGTCNIDETKPLKAERQLDTDCKTLMCGGGHEARDETQALAAADEPNNCETQMCVGDTPTVVEDLSDKPLDPGYCKTPECNELGYVPDGFDRPLDVERGDCKVWGCANNEPLYVNGEDAPTTTTVVDVPGDCRAPGCSGGSYKADGRINDGDAPKDTPCMGCVGGSLTPVTNGPIPGKPCFECSNGIESPISGQTPIAGEACKQCNNGVVEALTNDYPAQQCKVCSGGELVNSGDGTFPVSGNTCTVCQGGVAVAVGSPECQTANEDAGEITLTDRNDNNQVEDGETIYITAEPRMPNLEATVSYVDSSGISDVNWAFISSHPRREKKVYTEENKKHLSRYCEDSTVDNIGLSASLGLTESWDLYQSGNLVNPHEFFGATEVVDNRPMHAAIYASGAEPLKFEIKGRNPTRSVVERYISNHIPQPTHAYAYRMALWESDTAIHNSAVMLQFNRTGLPEKYRGTPNYGAPDGWGIFQIDHSSFCDKETEINENPVPTEVVWNWKVNVSEGISVINKKNSEVVRRFNDISRYIMEENPVLPTEDAHPSPLPATTVIGGVEFDIHPLEACKIQAYNGLLGVETQNARRENGSTYTGVGFCMIYDVDTRQWTFDENWNSYVYEVLTH